ncbi:MAG: SMI1/KNR4 family protein [Planctomyces sp.]|nr:SMI1/KNR4 family protein [Planctomyces sp.]
MKDLLLGLRFRSPASDESIASAEAELGHALPSDYVEFVKITNGGEGPLGPDAYIMFWPVEELAKWNRAYDVHLYAPGFLLIGTDLGGEAFGFDTRVSPWPVVQLPFIGMEWDQAIPRGGSFTEFLNILQGPLDD